MNIKMASPGVPELLQFTSSEQVQCIFRLFDERKTSRSFQFVARAEHEGKPVGFEFEVAVVEQGSLDAELQLMDENVYDDALLLTRTGDDSDRWLEVLNQQFDQGLGALRLKNSNAMSFLVLAQGQLNWEQEPIKLRVFAGDEETAEDLDYSEFYLTIDRPNQLLLFSEKKPEFRNGILRGLSA